MNKDALDAIGEVIKAAMAGSDARIRRLENELALLGDNHAAAIKALESKHQDALAALQLEQAAVSARVHVRESEAKALSELVEDVRGVNVILQQRIPAAVDEMKAAMASGNLELLALIEAVEQKTVDNAKVSGEIMDNIIATDSALDDTVQAMEAANKALQQTTAEVKALEARVAADTKAHPIYQADEVVRKGDIRRFGFGGLFEAVYDTAKGVDVAPDAWRMLSDGLFTEESDLGLRLRSFSGNVDTIIHHGTVGAVGQRGKQGEPGLRGNDGVGIGDVVVSEHGMFLELTSGKSFVFDFTKPLERAIRDIAPTIESIALKAMSKPEGV